MCLSVENVIFRYLKLENIIVLDKRQTFLSWPVEFYTTLTFCWEGNYGIVLALSHLFGIGKVSYTVRWDSNEILDY